MDVILPSYIISTLGFYIAFLHYKYTLVWDESLPFLDFYFISLATKIDCLKDATKNGLAE